MNSNLILIPTKGMSEEEWLIHRQGGVGGSEIGTIMHLNHWESELELYHRKIGASPLVKHENEPMFWGKEHEETIAKNWQYFDGSVSGMISRRKLGKEHIFRKCRRINSIVKNPKYPSLLGNIDRVINQGQVRVFDGQILEKEGILEVKTVREYALKLWEAEVPPQYVFQFMAYMGICELEYAELAVLKDGNSFDVIPFEFSPTIFEAILTKVNTFWERVKKGRMLMNEIKLAQQSSSIEQSEYIQGLLDQNEPLPTMDDAVARESYLNKRFLATEAVIKGGLAEMEAARNYVRCNKAIKGFTEEKAYYSTLLKNFMKECDVLDLGPQGGEVTWKADKNGTRSLKTTKLIMS